MSDSLEVFIMGAGRMGEILARSLSGKHAVTIYDHDEKKGRLVAEGAGCGYSRPPEALPGSEVVVMALPPAVTAQALASISGFLKPGTVVINIATTVLKDDLRPYLEGQIHLVGAKIVGHYREMGERPAILVDADTKKGGLIAGNLLSSLGLVEPGDERIVKLINTVATREAFRAAVTIENILLEAGAGPELIRSALRVVAAGSIKSYAEGDIGPFALELLKELKGC